MIKLKAPISPLETAIIQGIEDVQAKNIKFHNIAFDGDTIEDYEGRVYIRRKKGKWIEDGHHIRCNRCSAHMCRADREGDVIPRNFCPNCRADMKGDTE